MTAAGRSAQPVDGKPPGSERHISVSDTRSGVFISSLRGRVHTRRPRAEGKYKRGEEVFTPFFLLPPPTNPPVQPLCWWRAQGATALVSGDFGDHLLSRLCARARALTGKLLNFSEVSCSFQVYLKQDKDFGTDACLPGRSLTAVHS